MFFCFLFAYLKFCARVLDRHSFHGWTLLPRDISSWGGGGGGGAGRSKIAL